MFPVPPRPARAPRPASTLLSHPVCGAAIACTPTSVALALHPTWELGGLLAVQGLVAAGWAVVAAHRARRLASHQAQLEQKNRELESFSYSVSHDLRSPLRHINGFSELLRRSALGALDEQGTRYLDTISDAAQRASSLVDELLAFSRLGHAELKRTRVDMQQVFETAWDEALLEAGGRTVAVELRPLPTLEGDGAMLHLVARNLLSNAVKFTRPTAAPTVRVHCERQGDDWVFEVSDNGVGFPPEHSDRLFGAFKRLHADADFEGFGIGLANVRRIVERHGGRTWAKGAPGEGASFFFALPIDVGGRQR